MLSFNVFGEKEEIDLAREIAMSHFDDPLLLGKWISESRYDKNGDKYAMTLFLASDYSYSLLYLQNNKTMTFDYGLYSFNNKNLKLISSLTSMMLEHEIDYNYNKLSFGKIPFVKYPEMKISGKWLGLKNEKTKKNIVQIENLTLTPNYLFTVKFKDGSGKIKDETGVYIVEQNRILFLYKSGHNVGNFKLIDDELSLNIENGELLVKMKRESAF